MIVSLISIYLGAGFCVWLWLLDIRDISSRADKYRFNSIERAAFICILHVLILIFTLTAWPLIRGKP